MSLKRKTINFSPIKKLVSDALYKIEKPLSARPIDAASDNNKIISDEEGESKPAIHLLNESVRKQHIQILVNDVSHSSANRSKSIFYNSDHKKLNNSDDVKQVERIRNSNVKLPQYAIEDTMNDIEEFNLAVSPERSIKNRT